MTARSRLTSLLVAIAALVAGAPGVATAVTSGTAPAGFTPAAGWVVVRHPSTSAAYTPAPADRGNSTGGVNTVDRNVTGSWIVTMPGLGVSGGTVQVSPLNRYPRFCSVGSWGLAPDLEIAVTCRRRDGVAVDTKFVVLFAVGSGVVLVPAPRLAYVLNDVDDADHTPTMTWQYSSNGETFTVDHLGVGRYALHLGAIPDAGGTILSSVTDALVASCRVVDWDDPGDELVIRVTCRGATGVPSDETFTVLHLWRLGPEGTGGGPAAYLWADQPTAASYTPPGARRFSTAGERPTVRRTAVGVYQATLPGMPAGGAALVTAYGTGSSHCQLGSIRTSGTPQRVGVRCFKPDGTRVDSRFTLAYTR
jgi:hypothetical protein